MRQTSRTLLAMASVAGGVLALRRWRSDGPSRNGADVGRWQAVTVNRRPDEVAPDGQVPGRLGGLGDAVEIQVRPAPGDRGTELAARPRPGAPASGEDPRRNIRMALRDTKQLIETGEILGPHRPPTTQRTLLGLPLDAATRSARREGRL